MEFVHLHVNSEFSLLKSAAKIDSLINKAKDLQYSALAITDQNVMYGVLPFYKACRNAGIIPIIGIELSVLVEKNNVYQLILLAKTYKGYQNLIKLSSIAQTSKQNFVDESHVLTYKEDLVAISSAYKGDIQTLLTEGYEKKAIEKVQTYKQHFGNDFYLGIHDHFLAVEKQLNLKLIKFAKENEVELVVTNQVMYVQKEDALAHKCLQAIDQGTTLKEVVTDFKTDEYYLKTKREINDIFKSLPKAMANANIIAEKCNVEIPFGIQALPKYPLQEGENSRDVLYKLCINGAKRRYSTLTEQVTERLQYELGVIDQMNFNDYFLIVWDFMKFAHEKRMITGPGRGSAAGSIVAYVLNITNVDPIKYELLFERFLNPERISMPDIDIDFPDTRREEVIDYVYQKYGKNHVAQIITFGTLAAKAALRDVGKVIGIPLKQIDHVAKQISSRPNLTIDEAIKETASLKKLALESEQIRDWFLLAKRVEGIPRHASTHAAGIVISEDPLTDKVPLQQGHYDVLLTQYPMNILEEIGLLKMDFLGLRNLSFIEEIVYHVSEIEGDHIELEEIPFTDPATFQLLGQGDTTGVFQLESPGMRRVLTNLKPTEFEDIVAVNALYRPGPMENIPLYIAGKHKKRQVTYEHEDLKPILEKTYGVIVYQEQIMQIASKMAGFSLGEADILRRAVSKKKLETLEQQRERFVQGCKIKGYHKKIATDVYDLIVRFANYGFNRSHSVAYSVISYQLAYLKANYPTAFFAALLTSAIGQHQKVNQYIVDAKKRNISILPPSINDSYATFTVIDKQKICFGLAAIKNVGVRAIEEIVAERRKRGPYNDISEFCARISTKHINRRALESLVAAGCFDEVGHHRAGILASLDYAIEYGEQIRKLNEGGQQALFQEEIEKPLVVQVPPFKETEKLYFEKEVLGFYLSSHPIEEFLARVNSYRRTTISAALENRQSTTIRLAGLVEALRIIKTKKGEQMAFISLSDESGEMNITVFPKTYRNFNLLLREGQLIFIEGKLELTDERTQMIASKVTDVNNIKEKKETVLYLKVDHFHFTPKVLNDVKETIREFPGSVKVILYYEEKNKIIQLSDDYNLSPSNQCLEALSSLLGKENVVIKS